MSASALYNSQIKQDGKRVMDTLKKAWKICDVCLQDKNFYLFIDLLNRYLHFFLYQAPFLEADDINNLLDHIKEQVDSLEDKKAAEVGLKYFENTKKAIKLKAATN